jgi:hypothetical protein
MAGMYNDSGQMVIEQAYPLKPGINRISFEKGDRYPPGTYFMKLSWEGRTAWGRISLY